MKRSIRILTLPLLCGAALAAGCSDSKGGPTEPINNSGSMSYAYDGGFAGNFSASGAVPGSSPEGKTWAIAARDGSSGAMVVEASRAQTGGTYDFTVVVVPSSTAGTYTINTDCDEEDCAGVMAFFGMDTGRNATFDRMCYLSSGTITVTSTSGGRARGSFSGTGSCAIINTEGAEQEEFTIQNGQFDTSLVTVTR